MNALVQRWDSPIAAASVAAFTTRPARADDLRALRSISEAAFALPWYRLRSIENWLRYRHLSALVLHARGVYVLEDTDAILGGVWLRTRGDGTVECANLCLHASAQKRFGRRAWSRFFCEALLRHVSTFPVRLRWESERRTLASEVVRAFARRGYAFDCIADEPAGAGRRYEFVLRPFEGAQGAKRDAAEPSREIVARKRAAPSVARRVIRAISRWGERVLAAAYLRFEDVIRRRSPLGANRFFPTSAFGWTRALEANVATIRAELVALLRYEDALPNIQDVSPDQAGLTADDKWKTVFFSVLGRRIDATCATCPHTVALLDAIPQLTGAFFSILRPGKVLPLHRGPYAGFLRYHIGLIVPEPAVCALLVGGEVRHWQEGVGLVFDDSFEHSAWNRGERVRAVLAIDIERPLPRPWSWFNRFVIRLIARTSFVTEIAQRQAEWQTRFAETTAPPI